jgi:hypothetical protein
MLKIRIRIHHITARSTPREHIAAPTLAYIEGTYVCVYMHIYGPSRSSNVDSDVYTHIRRVYGSRIWQPYVYAIYMPYIFFKLTVGDNPKQE